MKFSTLFVFSIISVKASLVCALSVDQFDGEITVMQEKDYLTASSLGSDVAIYNHNETKQKIKKEPASLTELIELPKQQSDISEIESVIKDQNRKQSTGSILLK